MLIKSLLATATQTILNEAIQEELYASNLYLHLANHAQRLGLLGTAKYFKQESKDERKHYQMLADYINDRGGVAEIMSVDAIDDKAVSNLEEAIDCAYNAEIYLEKKYSKWYEKLISSDPVTANFLVKFLKIQRKSIGELGDIIATINLAGADECAILIIDKELGKK